MFSMEASFLRYKSEPNIHSMFPRQKRNNRRGLAATEFALVLPILLMLTFGTIEVCQVIFLREKAVLAAHEGARAAIRKMTTKAQTTQVVRDYLQVRGIDMSTISPTDIDITPAPELALTLTPINVRVRIPVSGNTVFPNQFYSWFSSSNRVKATVVMYKEFTHPNAAAGS